MRASDVMTADVVTAGPDTTVREIAALLLEKNVSAVPVVDAGRRVIGIVSEADLMRRPETRGERHRPWWLRMLVGHAVLAEEYAKAHGLKARDVMTRELVQVTPETDLETIAGLLETHRIKRVPVIRDGKLVGIVSRANLLRGLLAARPEVNTTEGDRAIRTMLLQKLKAQPWATIRDEDILVVRGVVSFWGAVASEEEQRALRVAAETIAGVRAVDDYTTVQPFFAGPAGAIA